MTDLKPFCLRCGADLVPGGFVFACRGKGAGRMQMPPHCPNRECQEAERQGSLARFMAASERDVQSEARRRR